MIIIEGNRDALYQWDLNQRLVLTDVNVGTEVHFDNENIPEDCCPVAPVYKENEILYADIPNVHLQNSGVLHVYMYVQENDKSFTKQSLDILVIARKKPVNYVYTETELKRWEDLESSMEDLETSMKGVEESIEIVNDAVKYIKSGANGCIIFNCSEDNKNSVGIYVTMGEFEVQDVEEINSALEFIVYDYEHVFKRSTVYYLYIDGIRYEVRTKAINDDTVKFVVIDEKMPVLEYGVQYVITFETENAVAFGKDNTNFANNGFVAGYNNKIDETGDQAAVFGYGHEVGGKNQFVSGYNHDVLEGEGVFVSGSSNKVKGRSKFLVGTGLESILTPDGAIVLGKYNVDADDALFILGGGFDKNQRKNLLIIDKHGNAKLIGNVEVSGTINSEKDISIQGTSVSTRIDRLFELIVGAKDTGYNSVKFGSVDNNNALGINSFVAGNANIATNDQGVVFGYGNTNNAKNSLIVGYDNKATEAPEGGDGAVALGVSNYVFYNGKAIGRGLTINDGVAVGQYNKDRSALFVVGCGYSAKDDDAIVVDWSGNVSIKRIKNDLNVEGRVYSKNTYPQTFTFNPKGDITNSSGTVVGVYDYNGKFNFSEPNAGKGIPIKNCLELIVPVYSKTLNKGVYEDLQYTMSGSYLSTIFSTCGYEIGFDDTEVQGSIVKIDGKYHITEDVTITKLILKTTQEKLDTTKYKGWNFTGTTDLFSTTVYLTDIIPESISAFRENKESDGVSTSLHLTSPNGTVFKITVDDNGTLISTKL